MERPGLTNGPEDTAAIAERVIARTEVADSLEISYLASGCVPSRQRNEWCFCFADTALRCSRKNGLVVHSLQFENSTTNICGWREGLRHFRAFALTMFVAASAGYLIYQLARERMLGDLARLVEERVNQSLGEIGWRVAVGRAEWLDGNQLRLERIRLFPPQDPAPAVDCGAIMIQLHEMGKGITFGELAIRSIQISQDFHIDIGVCHKHDLSALWSSIANRPAGPTSTGLLFPIVAADVALHISDSSGQWLTRPWSLKQVQMTLAPRRELTGEWVSLSGSFACDECAHVDVSGFWNPSQGTWHAAGQARQAVVHEGLLELAPQELRAHTHQIELLRARAAIDFSVRGSTQDNAVPQWVVRVEACDVACFDRRWAQPILGGSLTLRWSAESLEALQVRGRLGSGEIDLRRVHIGWRSPMEWSVSGTVKGLEINRQWLSILPDALGQLVADLDPHGALDLYVEMSAGASGFKRDLRADLRNFDFCFKRFPYRLNHGVGTVRWIGDQCHFSMQSLEQGQVVHVTGWAEGWGPGGAYQIDFSNLGELSIDQKLLTAIELYPRAAAQVRACNIDGRFSVRGRLYKQRTDARPTLDYDIRLAGCSMRHQEFPYLVRDVTGNVLVRGGRLTFHQVVGHHFDSRLTCDGGWSESDGLLLRIIGNDVALDRELHSAVPVRIQQVWDALQPQGTIDLARVDLNHKPGVNEPDLRLVLEFRPQASATARAFSIQPRDFPFRWDRMSGRVELANGSIVLHDIKGFHGRTTVTCQGSGSYDMHRWRVDLDNLWGTGIRIDDELLQSLPTSLASGLRALDYQGPVNLSGRVGFSHTADHVVDQGPVALVAYRAEPGTNYEQRPTIDWDVRLDLDQGHMQVGFPVENVFGAVLLRGQFDGRQAKTSGEILLDSLSVLNMQFVNVRGPLAIDSRGVFVGTFARDAGRSSRNSERMANDTLRGELGGGQVVFDGKIWQDELGSTHYYLQTAGDRISARSLAAQWAAGNSNLSGIVAGQLRLSGRANDRTSMVGDGRLEMKQAQLYELPLFVAILQLLLRPDKSSAAFDACRVEFNLQHEQVNLQRIELVGDTVSLLGNGQMNWHRQIDLNFFTVAGRNRFYIPIVSELYEMGSQQILWITVNGTLDQPRTQQIILPQMNDILKQLLGEPR